MLQRVASEFNTTFIKFRVLWADQRWELRAHATPTLGPRCAQAAPTLTRYR